MSSVLSLLPPYLPSLSPYSRKPSACSNVPHQHNAHIQYMYYYVQHQHNAHIHVLLSTLSHMFRRLLRHLQGELYRLLKTVVTLSCSYTVCTTILLHLFWTVLSVFIVADWFCLLSSFSLCFSLNTRDQVAQPRKKRCKKGVTVF